MHIFTPLTNPRYSAALLLLRVVVGLAFVLHGLPKIQDPTHWDDLGPLHGVPGWLQAASALAEFGGGILLIVGFLTPIAALLIVIDMLVAIFGVHLPGGGKFVGGKGSFELPLTYFAVTIAMIALGPGAYSIDALIFRQRGASKYRR
jgi:putative oxidoreductase